MTDNDYDTGLRDGKIKSLESQANEHKERIDSQERRTRTIEKLVYGLVGAIALIEIIPAIKAIL